jgi:hypothetical protein
VLDGDEQPVSGNGEGPHTETAISCDPGLTEGQKEALLAVYRSYRAANR